MSDNKPILFGELTGLLIGFFLMGLLILLIQEYWKWAASIPFTKHENLNGTIVTAGLLLDIYLTGILIGPNHYSKNRFLTGGLVWASFLGAVTIGYGGVAASIAIYHWLLQ